MDQTTTEPDAPLVDASQAQAQSNDGTSDAAAQPAEPTKSTEPAGADTSDDSTLSYQSLKDWADKKGFDLSTEEGQAKAFKSMQEAEKRMHESTSKASSLEKSIADSAQQARQDGGVIEDEGLSRLNRLEMRIAVNDFFAQEGVDAALRPKMAEIAQSNPNLAYMVENGVLTLQNLYDMARGADAHREQSLKAEGGKEALEKVAAKQQAKAVSGSATSSELTGEVNRENFDSWYAGLSPAQRSDPKNQEIVNRLLA